MSRSIGQRKPRTGAVLCVLAFAACGDDSSSSTPITPAPTRAEELRGVVVDGYIEGATVYLDLNGNYAHDEGEPVASRTDAKGNFTLSLSGITAAQREHAFLAADVPETAKDSDDNGATLKEAGKNAFTLLAPLPREASADAGVSAAVVSPLAALVASEMISAGIDLAEAHAAVQAKLGLSGRELLADFVANPDPVLQNVARVAAVSLGDALRTASTSDAGVSAPGQRVADALENVRAQLPNVVDALGLRDGGTVPAADVLREWAEKTGIDRDAGIGIPPIFAPPVLPADPRDAAVPGGGDKPAERDAGAEPRAPEVRDAGASSGGETSPVRDAAVPAEPAERDAGAPDEKPAEPPVRDVPPVRDAGTATDKPPVKEVPDAATAEPREDREAEEDEKLPPSGQAEAKVDAGTATAKP